VVLSVISLCRLIGERAVGSARGAPYSATDRAIGTLTLPRLNHWAARSPRCQTHPQLLRRRQGCDLPPNKAWCHNSGRNEIECDNRCRHLARKSSAHRRAAPGLSDNSHRNGKRYQSDAARLAMAQINPIGFTRGNYSKRAAVAVADPFHRLLPTWFSRYLADPVGCRRAAWSRIAVLMYQASSVKRAA
jgi:hypothetical protein